MPDAGAGHGAAGNDAIVGGAGSGAAGAIGVAGVGAAGVTGGGAGAIGTAGSGVAGAGGAPALGAVWTFPALITDKTRGAVFPTYMAHLLGKKITSKFPTDLVCADITNPGGTVPASIVVTFSVYGQDATMDFSLQANGTHKCVTPIFDLTKLYALHDATAGRIEAKLVVGGATISSAMKNVSIAAVDDIAWVDGTVPAFDMEDLSAVFVTPKDPKVDQLQRLAAESSVFGGFGSGDPYSRDPYLRTANIPAADFTSEFIIVEAGESVAWTVTTISGGATATIDVYLFTLAQYDDWTAGKSSNATKVWKDQAPGAKGAIAVPAGGYAIAFFNTGTILTRSIEWARNATREDVSVDVLSSIFAALKSLNTKYSNIPNTYFNDFQHIRRAPEVLTALSANCIDGSLLFASTLELLGMEPVVILKTGHAYVGVKSAPGSQLVWPVETTMVGTGTFDDAFGTALGELDDDKKMDPLFHPIDVKAMRAKGILPLPQ